jgi:PAS domain S-box-containing protein
MNERQTPSILLVDDNEINRYTAGKVLRGAGFEVLEGTCGADALRLAADNPDLILLDVHLPDLDGFTVCARLKSDPATAAIPVLHLSAVYVDSSSRAQGLEEGADGYMVGPVDPRELLAQVRALLRIREAEDAARRAAEEAHAARRSLAESDARFRRIAASGMIGLLFWDLTGRITYANDVLLKMLGYGREELEAGLLDWRTITPPGWEAVDRAALRQLEASGVAEPFEKEYLRKDGTRVPVLLSVATFEGTREQGVTLVQDITVLKRLEASARHQAAELEETNRRKDEFLAMLGHELRTPLAPLSNALEVLRLRTGEDPQARWALEVAERQIRHAQRLVDDLLDVSRIGRGKLELRRERADLRSIVRHAIEASQGHFEARRHRLAVRLPSEPMWLEADPVRLAQTITNLLNNAAKYTEPEGDIAIELVREEAEAVVYVRDSGVGIDAEALPHVFDLFMQADVRPGSVRSGLGIGLALVRSLIELHGGKVQVHSAGHGHGSEFRVRLPLADEPAGQST